MKTYKLYKDTGNYLYDIESLSTPGVFLFGEGYEITLEEARYWLDYLNQANISVRVRARRMKNKVLVVTTQ